MSEPQRIPISFLITELDIGGAERALVQIVTGLSKDRWDPQVICLSGRGPLAEPLEQAGIPVTSVGADRVFSPRGLWRSTVGLTQILRQQQPTILQTFLFHANIAGRIAARRAGVPIVVSGIRVAERRSPWRLKLDRMTERFVDRHVCVSQGTADFSVRESGLTESKIVVIPNGVDVPMYRDATPADLNEFGIPDGAPTIISVGRLDDQKDPQTLISAVESLRTRGPQAHLLFVGHGPLEDELRAQHADSDFVHFAGWRSDVPELIKAADVFALSSRWEGMPNVILEAGAAGIPVVATRTEGTTEIIEHGRTGSLIEIGDASGLTDALQSILEHPEQTAASADRLQSVVAGNFTWPSVVDRYEQLYESLLNGIR